MGRWPRSLTSVAIPYGVTAPQQLNMKLFEVPLLFSLFFCFCLLGVFFVCVMREEIIVTYSKY